ncbi:unnamed protein product, partial [Musa acuminata subsp. burmannicoides]
KSFEQNETRCLHTITLVVLYIFLAETFMLILMPKTIILLFLKEHLRTAK